MRSIVPPLLWRNLQTTPNWLQLLTIQKLQDQDILLRWAEIWQMFFVLPWQVCSFRYLTFRDKFHFIRLYKTCVRYCLEYAVQAWDPWLKQDVDSQLSWLGEITSRKVDTVGLTTLCDLRLKSGMLETFKILKGIDDVDYHTWFLRSINNTKVLSKL